MRIPLREREKKNMADNLTNLLKNCFIDLKLGVWQNKKLNKEATVDSHEGGKCSLCT